MMKRLKSNESFCSAGGTLQIGGYNIRYRTSKDLLTQTGIAGEGEAIIRLQQNYYCQVTKIHIFSYQRTV